MIIKNIASVGIRVEIILLNMYQDARGQSVEGWYNLAKGKDDGKNQPGARESFRELKKRGSVRISFRFCTSAQVIQQSQ